MRDTKQAIAYFRTSSAANVGPDKDSLRRQVAAVKSYANAHGVRIVAAYYDAAVSGADPLDARPGFAKLLARITDNGVGAVLVEDASRFARDLMAQEVGYQRLKVVGVRLVPVNAPDTFDGDDPTRTLIRQVLGAVAQFEKAQLVAKLAAARERKRAAGGYAGGFRPSIGQEIATLARGLASSGASLREIARQLAAQGHASPSGRPFKHGTVKRLLARR
jgi:DNA invertase Pin-like site-specific DNA recombinase